MYFILPVNASTAKHSLLTYCALWPWYILSAILYKDAGGGLVIMSCQTTDTICFRTDGRSISSEKYREHLFLNTTLQLTAD